jgi:hypothetical protein
MAVAKASARVLDNFQKSRGLLRFRLDDEPNLLPCVASRWCSAFDEKSVPFLLQNKKLDSNI